MFIVTYKGVAYATLSSRKEAVDWLFTEGYKMFDPKAYLRDFAIVERT